MLGLTLTTGQAWASRRHVQNFTNFVKNVKIMEFHDHIWIHLVKCIQISPNMPEISSLIRKINVKIAKIWENHTYHGAKFHPKNYICFQNCSISLTYLKSPWEIHWNKYKHAQYWFRNLWDGLQIKRFCWKGNTSVKSER